MSRTLAPAILIAALAGPAAAAPPASDAVVTDAAIRDWLATHPELVDKLVRDALLRQPALLAEVSQAQAAKARAEQEARLRDVITRSHDALYDDRRDGRAGAASAAATMVVFGDVECPFCKAVQPALSRLVAEHADFAVIYKEFPILGPASLFAAKALLAAVAQGQGGYGAFHAALMASKTPEHQLKEGQIIDMAAAAGLDVARLRQAMDAPEIEAKIAANKALAASLGIQGTPGILIGERLVPGNLPYEQMLQLVQQSR